MNDATTSWRNHPKLLGRFHPQAPDDVQVLVHDGGPRLTDRLPEAVWVTVTGCLAGDVFTGRILNQPQQLKSVAEGSVIKFVAPGGDHLLMVTDKYLRERPHWKIHPCNQCGLDELFDAPSDLITAIFPNTPAGATMAGFTSFCGVCRGVQMLENRDMELPDDEPVSVARKKWWEFWK